MVESFARGGHVGFVAAGRMGEPVYWLEQRIPSFLAEHLASLTAPDHADRPSGIG